MKIYTTISGDTFDKIAYDQLGSEYLFPLIIEENQQYRDVLIFSSGVELTIPEVELDDYDNIPEWMSGDLEDVSGVVTKEDETTPIVVLDGVDS